ncbi:hypothetical protein B0H19DRAFT_1183821 [Mycena capillaripes]|nr:hypothetical protein B0H19DRAFT_1183821 [Mycena capillaripes]
MDPRLPLELEHKIFELAALSEPGTIQPLLRVARHIRFWIEPILYRTLWVDGYAHADRTYAVFAARESKPAGFLTDAIRHVFVDETSHFSRDEARTLLRLCEGIVNIVINGRFAEPGLLPILADMSNLGRLSVKLIDLFAGTSSIDFSHALFASLTHLHLWDTIVVEDAPIYARAAALPALTHLCLNTAVPWDLFDVFLTDCKPLQLLVNLWPSYRHDRAREIAKHVRDARFVVASMAFTLYRLDWAGGVDTDGGRDFWVVAEEFVAQKRRGEASGAFIAIPPPDFVI